MSIYLGFDPGGAREFGWCVARESSSGALPLTVLRTGVALYAMDAVEAAICHVPAGEPVLAAGIDAPLVWSRGEGRRVEQVLRQQVRLAGSETAEGTVQHVNSLRGACVAQGMLTAVFLREAFAGLPLSEAHPKAWLWLSKATHRRPTPAEITLADLSEWCSLPDRHPPSEHERDAAVACLSAWAMIRRPQDWHDLYLYAKEAESYSPLNPLPSYWMPKPPTP
ncbi:MAG TPA: hypothetical protein VF173_32920 [Thermoanaerobaculia bacterium]|nr:hypothetical protein [Thermoanaerobaculia bacterium]